MPKKSAIKTSLFAAEEREQKLDRKGDLLSTLNQQEWDRFMHLLDNPPPPNAALRAAMQRHHALLD